MSPVGAGGPEGSHPHSEPQALLMRWSHGSCDHGPAAPAVGPVTPVYCGSDHV